MICLIKSLLFFVYDFFRYLTGKIKLLVWTDCCEYEGDPFGTLVCRKCGKKSEVN